MPADPFQNRAALAHAVQVEYVARQGAVEGDHRAGGQVAQIHGD